MSWHLRTRPGLSGTSRIQRQLMRDMGSLSRSLDRLCKGGFHVELIRLHCTRPLREEALALRLPVGTRSWVREVLLKCHDKNLVYARTVMPLRSLVGGNRRLRRPHGRPLGNVLFRTLNGGRKRVEYRCLNSSHPMWTELPGELLSSFGCEHLLWGRRSLFELHCKPLLITEFFSPELWLLETPNQPARAPHHRGTA